MGYFKEFWKGGEGQTEAAVHSGAFHKYFEGYVEQKQSDPRTGRSRIVRIYVAPYYLRRGTDAQWKQAKACSGALYLLSMVLFLLSVTVLELENPAKFYQFFIAGGFLCAFYTTYVFLHYLSAPRKMTIGVYRSFCPALERSCLVTACFLLAAVPARLLCAILAASPFTFGTLGGFVCLAGAGGAMLGIWLLEHRSVYDMVENKNADVSGFRVQR